MRKSWVSGEKLFKMTSICKSLTANGIRGFKSRGMWERKRRVKIKDCLLIAQADNKRLQIMTGQESLFFQRKFPDR